jgi:predicted ATP-grasp superfamily ATP-dependent carboligase
MINNILLFPSGSQVAHEIYNSLKYEKYIECIGADNGNNNWSYFVLEKYVNNIPMYNPETENEFIGSLKYVIGKYKITCIIPCFDRFIPILKNLERALGVIVIAPDIRVCNICQYKSLTYNELKEDIIVPDIYSNDNIEFPLFIKPDNGYGSRDSHKVLDEKEFEHYYKVYNSLQNYILCEYLPGDEFTVDCLSNREEVLVCSPRKRIRTIQGISVNTESVLDESIVKSCKDIAIKIFKKLKIIGCWFFQVKFNSKNELCLLEIAPRIAGAMCLTRNMGVNLPLLSIYIHLGIDVNDTLFKEEKLSVYKVFKNVFMPKKEYNTLYIDLDDTIIIKGKVNTDIIAFLYQNKNNNKKIALLTRNKRPKETLINNFIDPRLFDEIIIVENDNKKSLYINKENKSLFIDDSYRERKDVSMYENTIVIGLEQVEKYSY